jgi:hypothetical protein
MSSKDCMFFDLLFSMQVCKNWQNDFHLHGIKKNHCLVQIFRAMRNIQSSNMKEILISSLISEDLFEFFEF